MQKLLIKQGYNPPMATKKLNGTIWGITTFFNNDNNDVALSNLKICIKNLQKQGLHVICAEVAVKNEPFILNDNIADKVIYLRSKSIMWQREAAINKCLQILPLNCDKVVWLDADIIFDNDEWVNETCKQLEKYQAIQPFTKLIRLKKDSRQSKNITYQKILNIFNKSSFGTAYSINTNGKKALSKSSMYYGNGGIAWAHRRSNLENILLYDSMIIGGGDIVNTHSMYTNEKLIDEKFYSKSLKNDVNQWRRSAFDTIKGSVNYVDGNVYHLWHGDQKNRLYQERKLIWGKYKFDPFKDIKKNSDGLWEWHSNKKEMHDWVSRYFKNRIKDINTEIE